MNEKKLIDIALGRTKFPMRFDRDRALQALQLRSISCEGIRELTTNFASLQPDGLITSVQAQGEDITLYVPSQDQFYIAYTFVTRILDSQTIHNDVLAEALPLLRIDGVGAIFGDVRLYVFGLIPIHKGFYSGGTQSVQDTLLRVLRERYGVDYGYDVEAWRAHIILVEKENQLQYEEVTQPFSNPMLRIPPPPQGENKIQSTILYNDYYASSLSDNSESESAGSDIG